MTIYLLSLHSWTTGFPYPFRNSEQGKHDELLAQEGIYKEMYFSQKKTAENI